MATVTEHDQNIQNSRGVEPNGVARIKSLVQQFAVCWEAHPEQVVVSVLDPKAQAPRVKRELRKIGFSLALCGTPEPGAENVSPGCHDCLGVQSSLEQIARWILPREERQCMYEIRTEPQSLIYSRMRADRPDVRLTITIFHRNNWDQPIDECQEYCLKDMEQALHEVGACEGAWNVQETSSGEARCDGAQ
jgi:hypothetical protein